MTRCVCMYCSTARLHSPPDCRGCLCDKAQPTGRTTLRVATIPQPHKDVDELLRYGGDALYERMIATAVPAMQWRIEHIEVDETPEGRQAAAETMAEPLANLPPVERDEYVQRLAARLNVREAALRGSLNEAYVGTRKRKPPQSRPPVRVDLPED